MIDLERQMNARNLIELQKIIHKLKPSVLSLEVKGAKEDLASIDAATSWNEQVQESVERLLHTFNTIKPLMQQDLETYGDE
ncbi:hypothetical protein SAMN05518672_103795 [Chitinophaga sp. CF118]|nr:hypothetical protein SAMN05518672_103795 [Chitinophaga sp. CF118]